MSVQGFGEQEVQSPRGYGGWFGQYFLTLYDGSVGIVQCGHF